jgi:predicted metal-dependent hydrolase
MENTTISSSEKIESAQKLHFRPSDLEIKVRKVNFEFRTEELRRSIQRDPVRMHFLNSLSLLLPAFENFFIQTIKKSSKSIGKGSLDATLLHEIKSFCHQEAAHSLFHRRFNQTLQDLGYSFALSTEKLQSQILRWAQTRLGDHFLLGLTSGGEHITAVMGEEYLSKPHVWSKDSESVVNLFWLWHATEEVEHKAVCFDIFQSVSGNWWVRIFSYLFITLPTLIATIFLQLRFLHVDGLLLKLSTWKALFKFHFDSDGILRAIGREYFKYFAPRFHPWESSNPKRKKYKT